MEQEKDSRVKPRKWRRHVGYLARRFRKEFVRWNKVIFSVFYS